MDNLTKYLVDNAETLVGNPVRLTDAVLSRSDCALYTWRKMGMTHNILCSCSNGKTDWQSIAPAAHLYPLSADELCLIKHHLDKFYLELKDALGSIGSELWYLVKGTEDSNEWTLFQNSENIGSVDIGSAVEVECASDADEALVNLVLHLVNDFPNMCELSSCIVLPYGCKDSDVWEYASQVVLLGEVETNQFIDGVVSRYTSGLDTIPVSPKW